MKCRKCNSEMKTTKYIGTRGYTISRKCSKCNYIRNSVRSYNFKK